MLTDERMKQLMQQVGMPDSTSLYRALRQCDMETTLAERERCSRAVSAAFDETSMLEITEKQARRRAVAACAS